MQRIPLTLPPVCYPKKDPENPCPCQDRPMELAFKTCLLFWNVSIGEQVTEGQIVAEFECEKKTSEIPAPVSGILAERCFEDGDAFDPSDILGYIEVGPHE